MRSVQIYVENQLLDLFNDEQIIVNSSVQNISDIGKVFTDFSQTFTIPCSPRNNEIFEWYYNNDVDNQIDHNRRRSARIEIDHTPFRTGKIQLEKSQIKSNYGESYTVTFYGDVVTLKDLIGEDMLKDLDYTGLDHTYSGAEIQARIEDDLTTDYDVVYPLISSTRVWQYDDASTNDISLSGNAIDYTELFPAVRVKSLFDKIESQYSVTFTGSWLDTNHFKKLFLWYKNKESFTFYTKGKQLEFGEAGASTDNLYNDTVQYSYIQPNTLLTGSYDVATNIRHNVSIEIFTGSSIDYYIDVFDNGEYLLSLEGNGSQLFNLWGIGDTNTAGLDRNLTFFLRSTAAMSFSNTVTYTLSYNLIEFSPAANDPQTVSYSDSSDTSLSTTAVTDLSYLAPDIKIVDFMNGIFQVFNLTCVGESATTFRIEPLETFYNSGVDWDITKWTDFETIDVARPKLWNNISFKYQQSNSFMNREFYDLFRREYADLTAAFGYDGGDYTIQLPFETILHSKFTDTNLQVGWCLGTEPEYKNYVPKPTLLYQYDQQSVDVSFYFDNGSTSDEITNYIPYGQDTTVNDDNYTICWGSEISSFTLGIEPNTLYRTYYEPYLLNLYDLKTRIVTVKCNLPIYELTNIRLNDSLIIRDKKYLINDMKTNLVTGEVELVLLSNWRGSQYYGGVYEVSCASQTLEVPFSVPEGTTITIGTPLESQFATPDDTTPTGNQTVNFTITSNGTGSQRVNTFPLTIVVRGVTMPTQELIIIQRRCRNRRIIEDAGPIRFRTTENRIKRITE